MRKLLVLFLLLPTLGWSQGQTFTNGANGGVNYVLVAPAGACLQGSPMRVVLGAGTIYTCQTLTWTLNAAAGGDAGVGVCTNQVVTATVSNAAPTCTTLTSAYVNNTIALTGTDVNTSNQVTVTHLASPLPKAQGGTAADNSSVTFPSSGTIPTTGTLVNGNYASATAAGAIADSTVTAGPYAAAPWYTAINATGTTLGTPSTTANKITNWGVVLTYPITTTQVSYSVTAVADNTANLYDLCLSDSTGALKAHIGATAGTTFAPSAGVKTLSWTGSATLMPGKYYIGLTSNCAAACAILNTTGATQASFYNAFTTQSITAGGTCSAFTPPADILTVGGSPIWLMVR